MKLTGKIVNDDYVNCMVFTKLQPSAMLTGWSFLSGLLAVIVAAISGGLLMGPAGVSFATKIGMVVFFTTIGILHIRTKIWLSVFRKTAELNNTGMVTYLLEGESIKFIGPMYSCDIPISAIRAVKKCNGTGYFEFGNYSGFIFPREIIDGDADAFLSLVNEKVKNRLSN